MRSVITIVDYKAGNLTSVQRALAHLGIDATISADAKEIANAERIIFPGVGHAASAMKSIKERAIDTALATAYKKGTPIMGICLGTQIILEHSQEGDVDTLGLIDGQCVKFNLKDPTLKIPHMGWNHVSVTTPHFILKDLKEDDQLYFVHSYYPQPTEGSQVFATTEYEVTFACAVGHNSLFAVQFHPEKSGPVGLQMLKNFSQWDGTNA